MAAIIIKASLLLLALKVAGNPHPAASLHEPAELLKVDRDLNDGPSTVSVTGTSTLYWTLIPPVLPMVTTTATRTSSVFTSTTTEIVNLNCTATVYSAILAPTSAISLASLPAPSSAVRVTARQVTESSSLILSSAVSSAIVPSAVTTTVATTTITATTTEVQRPPFTRTLYSVVVATQATPFVRTVSECSATQDVAYTFEIDTVTSTFARTVYPSTITTTTLVDCTARPTIPRAPPPASVRPTTGAMIERQVASVVSTTVHQTRIIYAATTITQTEPFTRVITSCNVATSAATSAATVTS